MTGEFLRRLQYYLRRRQFEAELDEEMRHHLALKERDSRAGGSAQKQFGNVTLLKEDSRTMWTFTLWEQLLQDLRYAVRTMMANRAFTALAVLSLALGIGANTAIYSFMDSILLRSLPVADAESLVVLNWHARGKGHVSVMHSVNGSAHDDKSGVTSGIFPFPAFELFGKSGSGLARVFAYYPSETLNLTAKGQTDVAKGEYVSGDYFGALAVSPAAGRLFIPDDDGAAAPPVAVLSHAFSQRRFGGAANAAGQTVLIDNVPFTAVGVAPPGFFGVDPAAAPDVYLPMHANVLVEAADQFGFRPADYLDRNYYWVEVMGRLRPGVSLAQLQSALAPQFQQWVAATAKNDKERSNLPALVVKEGAAGLDNLRREYSKPLYVLLALVGLILALACANVANLLLARAAARRREMALRLSVGAGRLRLIRQLLTESVLLASMGGALGVLFAIWGILFLTLLLANGQVNFTLHAQLNWHVLGVAAALSLITGVLFGLAPAIQSTRVDVMPALKETRTGQPGARHSFRRIALSHVLVSGQIAISLLMLFAAGLFVRTLSNLQSVELGFNRENVLLFELNALQAGHKNPEISTFYGDLRKRLSEIPGVRNVTLSNDLLIRAGFMLPLSLPGAEPNDANRLLAVGPAFFSTMQIPILAGREILEIDRPGSPAVVVINERFAKANFGSRNPLGQHLTLWKEKQAARDMEVIGVSRDARYGGLKGEIPPVAYIAYDQGYPEPDRMVYELRTAGDPLMYVNSVREIVHRADARAPVANVKTQAADIDQTINQEIVFAKLCTGFAILGLVIACVGLYGTVAYNVVRRTGEIGIRMALGAQRGAVVRMILRQVFVLAAVGLAIGLPTALGASRLVESFLFGMKPNDPWAMTLAVAILLGAALLAGYAPARKAARIDPMTALRHE
jgi:macrolide transport system ATP-binding/permease protein